MWHYHSKWVLTRYIYIYIMYSIPMCNYQSTYLSIYLSIYLSKYCKKKDGYQFLYINCMNYGDMVLANLTNSPSRKVPTILGQFPHCHHCHPLRCCGDVPFLLQPNAWSSIWLWVSSHCYPGAKIAGTCGCSFPNIPPFMDKFPNYNLDVEGILEGIFQPCLIRWG